VSGNDPTDLTDLTIIGAGPTGLFAAFYAGLRQMSVRLIDSLDVLGGQLVTLYPEKLIYDVAGFPSVRAKKLAANLIEQAMTAGPALSLGEQVQDLTHDATNSRWLIKTSRGFHQSRTVLIAAGVGAFNARKLNVPNAARFERGGLFYFVNELDLFRDQRVLIVGGGDSAVDWCNLLVPIARQVTLIHRSNRFRAHEQAVAEMRQSGASVLEFHELQSLEGGDRLERAVILDNRSKTSRSIEADVALVNIGFVSSLGPVGEWGLELERGAIKVDSTMRTNRPGIFAAGDVCDYPGKLKLIATGFGEAATAANNAKHLIDPQANVFPGHSTNLVR
jgi:thioredoxin reductase (NADPH)